MTSYPVIDADGHVNEGDVDLRPWLPEAYRPLAPIRLKDNRGHARILLEGRIWAASEGPHPGVSGPFAPHIVGSRPGMVDPQLRLQDMDTEGIDVAVLFGTQIALTVNGLMDKGLAAALCHAVNLWLAEYCAADRQRLRAVGLIPCQDPPAAVRELEWLAKQPSFVSAMLPTNVYGRNLGEPDFFPIYDAAQALEIPLCVHPQTGHDGQYGVWGVMGAGSERFFKYAYVHMTAFPFELMIALMHLIGEGVFDRFPRLRVGFMEGGIGWVPYWVERMDEHFEKLRPQFPNQQRRPSEIVRSEQVAFTCEPEEATLEYVLDVVGEEQVMYASDYAHWDCEFPNSVRAIRDRATLSPECKRRVLSENAIRFFRLENLPAHTVAERLSAAR
ncbi:MAG TPA: amidohydrolase family protein [Chloroflexota bacterium]|nr:amidohydrolase family protein [Chloroflexota bacterium]HZU05063.1 amidohydrolase family protein [Chloroflexota bacterium]